MEDKQDRRTQRTVEALIHALLALMESKHYDAISVQDIVQQANVGRSTFYAHFENKDALLIGGFSHLLDHLVEEMRLNKAGQVAFAPVLLFRHAYGHYEVYRTLLWGSGFELLMQDGHAAFSEKIEARLAALLPDAEPAVPLPVVASTLAGSLLILVKWWLDNNMPCSSDEMNEIFQRLVMPGVRGAMGE
jgi:AcrR family transcriptional regulator